MIKFEKRNYYLIIWILLLLYCTLEYLLFIALFVNLFKSFLLIKIQLFIKFNYYKLKKNLKDSDMFFLVVLT